MKALEQLANDWGNVGNEGVALQTAYSAVGEADMIATKTRAIVMQTALIAALHDDPSEARTETIGFILTEADQVVDPRALRDAAEAAQSVASKKRRKTVQATTRRVQAVPVAR